MRGLIFNVRNYSSPRCLLGQGLQELRKRVGEGFAGRLSGRRHETSASGVNDDRTREGRDLTAVPGPDQVVLIAMEQQPWTQPPGLSACVSASGVNDDRTREGRDLTAVPGPDQVIPIAMEQQPRTQPPGLSACVSASGVNDDRTREGRDLTAVPGPDQVIPIAMEQQPRTQPPGLSACVSASGVNDDRTREGRDLTAVPGPDQVIPIAMEQQPRMQPPGLSACVSASGVNDDRTREGRDLTAVPGPDQVIPIAMEQQPRMQPPGLSANLVRENDVTVVQAKQHPFCSLNAHQEGARQAPAMGTPADAVESDQDRASTISCHSDSISQEAIGSKADLCRDPQKEEVVNVLRHLMDGKRTLPKGS